MLPINDIDSQFLSSFERCRMFDRIENIVLINICSLECMRLVPVVFLVGVLEGFVAVFPGSYSA